MIMTEADRLAMMHDLDKAARGLWVEIYSELQYGGRELPIWVLVRSRDTIRAAFDLTMSITLAYREQAIETDFSISFDEFRDGHVFHWNHVEPYEVRSGRLMFELGVEATEDDGAMSVYETVRAARHDNPPHVLAQRAS